MPIDKSIKSNRLLQSKRYTQQQLGDSQEAFTSVLDINAGVFYQNVQRNKSRLYAGASMNHLTRQKINFTNTGDKLYAQIVVNLGADITTRRKDIKIQPQMMYFRNGPSNNLILGIGCEHILESGSVITNINKSSTFSYAAFYRWNDAVVANINYKIKNFRIGLSFDANVSRLKSASSGVIRMVTPCQRCALL